MVEMAKVRGNFYHIRKCQVNRKFNLNNPQKNVEVIKIMRVPQPHSSSCRSSLSFE